MFAESHAQCSKAALTACLLVFSLCSTPGSGDVRSIIYANESGMKTQVPTERRLMRDQISASFEGMEIRDALRHLEAASGVEIVFQVKSIPSKTVNIRFVNTPLPHALDRILRDTGLAWKLNDGRIHIMQGADDRHSSFAGSKNSLAYAGPLAQRAGNPDSWWLEGENDNAVELAGGRARRPAAGQRNRARALASLITSVIEPGTWRKPQPDEPETEPEPDVWW